MASTVDLAPILSHRREMMPIVDFSMMNWRNGLYTTHVVDPLEGLLQIPAVSDVLQLSLPEAI